MDNTPLSGSELDDVARRIADEVLTSVTRALTPARDPEKPDDAEDPNYRCTGLRFDCQDEYNCSAPDQCLLDFVCQGNYTKPKPGPKRPGQ